MRREEIKRLVEESQKAIDAEHESMSAKVRSELDTLKKKALSGV